MFEMLKGLLGAAQQAAPSGRHLVVDEDGNIVNVVMIDPNSEWPPPPGHTLVPSEEGGTGWLYQNGKVIDPNPPPSPPPMPKGRPEPKTGMKIV